LLELVKVDSTLGRGCRTCPNMRRVCGGLSYRGDTDLWHEMGVLTGECSQVADRWGDWTRQWAEELVQQVPAGITWLLTMASVDNIARDSAPGSFPDDVGERDEQGELNGGGGNEVDAALISQQSVGMMETMQPGRAVGLAFAEREQPGVADDWVDISSCSFVDDGGDYVRIVVQKRMQAMGFVVACVDFKEHSFSAWAYSHDRRTWMMTARLLNAVRPDECRYSLSFTGHTLQVTFKKADTSLVWSHLGDQMGEAHGLGSSLNGREGESANFETGTRCPEISSTISGSLGSLACTPSL